ncbi:MAG: hypothetical protein MIO88_02950 [Methanoregulaceae archaeon]|nr:hypothetical protein [Methanoregulaceae archaeon]
MVPADAISCLTGIYDRGKIRPYMGLLDRIREALSSQSRKKRKKLSDRPQDDEDEEEIEELIALDII